jgi:hypothetical protein
MKKLTLLFGCLISLVLSTSAQYTHTFADPVMDITSNIKSGTNAWKLLPGGGVCLSKSLAVGSDASLWCTGTDHYVYEYVNGAWVKQTAMGTSVLSLAVQNVNVIYSLQPNGVCSGGNYGIFKWTGSAWTQPWSPGCLSELSLSLDGFLSGVNTSNQLWSSTNGGVTWTQWSSGWIYVNMAYGVMGCAINAGHSIYEVSNSNPAINIPGPTGQTIVGCVTTPLDKDTLVVTLGKNLRSGMEAAGTSKSTYRWSLTARLEIPPVSSRRSYSVALA